MTLSTPARNPPTTVPMTTGTTRISAVVAMLRWPRSGSIAAVSTAMLARAATVPVMVRFSSALRSWALSARGRSSLVIAHLCRPD